MSRYVRSRSWKRCTRVRMPCRIGGLRRLQGSIRPVESDLGGCEHGQRRLCLDRLLVADAAARAQLGRRRQARRHRSVAGEARRPAAALGDLARVNGARVGLQLASRGRLRRCGGGASGLPDCPRPRPGARRDGRSPHRTAVGSPPWHFSQPTPPRACAEARHSSKLCPSEIGSRSVSWQVTQWLPFPRGLRRDDERDDRHDGAPNSRGRVCSQQPRPRPCGAGRPSHPLPPSGQVRWPQAARQATAAGVRVTRHSKPRTRTESVSSATGSRPRCRGTAEVGVGGVDPANTVLAHQNDGPHVEEQVAARMGELGEKRGEQRPM